MFTIKLNLCWIIQSFYDYINNKLDCNIDYCEIYFKPSKHDIYVKTQQGKKTVYKKIDYFFTTDQFSNGLNISLKDNSRYNEIMELDVELWPNY
tara:strand:+ start:1153 stop:1434 length:282 start_codon:yes stop_codon:yes gene_type:complete